MFDWVGFLRSNNVEYITRGSNVGRGQINVQCPWCGESDPSHHMTINLAGRGWRCFRNPSQHIGRAPLRLVQALIKCSYEHAREIVGGDVAPLPDDDNLADQVAANFGAPEEVEARPKHLSLPREFKPLGFETQPSPFARGFWTYLQGRGYSDVDIGWICAAYDLHYSVRGEFAYRVILPIHDERDCLMTWTGRSIKYNAVVRYKTLTSALSVQPTANLLLGLPLLWRAPKMRMLIVAEGPFDAIRISALCHADGIYGTCLFGLNVSEAQANLLEQLSARFKRMVMLLDNDAALVTLNLRDHLPRACRTAFLPDGVKDPGELQGSKGRDFLRELAA